MVLTYRYRVKSLNGLLRRQARAVNFVWNYCNDIQKTALARGYKWPSWFDLDRLTKGTSKELGLHSCTINAVCKQYAESRGQKKKPHLRYRGRRSLSWVPLKGKYLKVDGNAFRFASRVFRVFNSRAIPQGAKIVDGTNFSCDARGRWFLNVVLELPDPMQREITTGVGIDLGLHTMATLSTGDKIENPRWYARLQARLAVAQRARKQRLAKTVHAKITNSRGDRLHKESVKLVRGFDYIAVGNVSASRLAKTRMAKSVLDASWSSFRGMLRYKAIAHGAVYEEVGESFTTRVCSSCGSETGPKGVADLGIRRWVCVECGVEHDRDVNSALNILARSGHGAPAEGIPVP